MAPATRLFQSLWLEGAAAKFHLDETLTYMRKYSTLTSLLALALLFQACGETAIPDPDPKGSPGLDFTININQSPFTALQNVGGSATHVQNKVIIARLTSANWTALSSTCPNDPTSSITYNSGNQTFVCAKDNTVFDTNGKVVSGNSNALTKYQTTFSVNSGELRIYEN